MPVTSHKSHLPWAFWVSEENERKIEDLLKLANFYFYFNARAGYQQLKSNLSSPRSQVDWIIEKVNSLEYEWNFWTFWPWSNTENKLGKNSNGLQLGQCWAVLKISHEGPWGRDSVMLWLGAFPALLWHCLNAFTVVQYGFTYLWQSLFSESLDAKG